MHTLGTSSSKTSSSSCLRTDTSSCRCLCCSCFTWCSRTCWRRSRASSSWVVLPHSKQPLGDSLLSLRNMCKAQNFLINRAILSSGMLSYCSSEAAHKEDKTNFKANESVVLVGLAT
jgi:hypothetical protein